MSAVIERRALGALAFIDGATGAPVKTPLALESAGLSFVRNPSSLWVIRRARALEAHETAFAAPPATPPVESLVFAVTVRDPGGRYLPRTLSIRLPRSAAPASDPASAGTPIRVALYPGATIDIVPGAAVLRARIVSGTGAAVRGALLRLTPGLAGATPILAFSDTDGEAVAVLPGPPPFVPSADAPTGLAPDFATTIDVVLDPEIARTEGTLPAFDPDRIIARAADPASGVTITGAPAVRLSAGRATRTVITVVLP